MKTKILSLLALCVVFFSSCDVEDVKNDVTLPKATTSLYVLSDGEYGKNNSTLAYYDLSNGKLDENYFATQNGRGLGDVGNDMIQYGSKIYIVVNVSSQIEVINAKTGKSVAQIPMFEGKTAKQPRYIVSHNGKVYVSSYDNTVTRIDTATLKIDASATVGRSPEQLCIVGNKLYVANSGGMDYPDFDKTVSVVDITTFKEEKKINVGLNPTKLNTNGQNLYVACIGNYGTEPAKFQKIDTKTNEVVKTYEKLTPAGFNIYDNKAYVYEGNDSVKVLNLATDKIETNNFIADGTKLNKVYSVQMDNYNGDFYITDTDYKTKGNVFCFDKTGKLKFKIPSVGMNPNKVLFLK